VWARMAAAGAMDRDVRACTTRLPAR
jgi:hypothetical protein